MATVLSGIQAAQAAGIRVKINVVALAAINEGEIEDIILWAHGRGIDVTLIETMPLGEVSVDRTAQFLSLSVVRERLAERWTLAELDERTGGPSRYVRIAETGGKVGFITPLTHNFCAGCNRVRVTCTGTLFMCLGQEDAVDLRAPLRSSNADDLLNAAIDQALAVKPTSHDFVADRIGRPSVSRHMSVTGG